MNTVNSRKAVYIRLVEMKPSLLETRDTLYSNPSFVTWVSMVLYLKPQDFAIEKGTFHYVATAKPAVEVLLAEASCYQRSIGRDSVHQH